MVNHILHLIYFSHNNSLLFHHKIFKPQVEKELALLFQIMGFGWIKVDNRYTSLSLITMKFEAVGPEKVLLYGDQLNSLCCN
jgi:hypothetical protein